MYGNVYWTERLCGTRVDADRSSPPEGLPVTALLDSLPLANLPTWSTVLVLAPALAASCGSLLIGRASIARSWGLARAATGAMALAALMVTVLRMTRGSQANGVVRVDNVTVSVLGLICLVGAVVVRYSSVYLRGDLHEGRYARRMLATLAAVSLVVVANNVLLLVAAWAVASVALHGLLTFFGDRPAAIAVAHKKFLLARCADACMLGATVAFNRTFSTLQIAASLSGPLRRLRCQRGRASASFLSRLLLC